MKTIQRFAILMLVLSTSLTAGSIDIKLKKDQAVVDGITYTINTKKQTASVVKGQELYVGDIVIPDKIVVDSVTCYVESISPNAFKGCPGLTSIVIPDGILKIGNSAFEGCASLTEITLPGRIQEIPAELFKDCSSLTTIILPEGLKKMSTGTFQGCKSLAEFTFPAGITEIPANTFAGCSELRYFTLHTGTKKIGSEVFEDCTALEYIEIPTGVSAIAKHSRVVSASRSSVSHRGSA